MNLRRWLRREPRPSIIRADGRDVRVPTSGNVWASLEETLTAMNPTRLEALDDSGALLRAVQLEADDEPAAAAPAAPAGTSDAYLERLARIISDAHDAGAKRHADAYGLAFQENTKLVQLLAHRLSGLETAWSQAMRQVAEAQQEVALASANPGEGGMGEVVAMFAQAAAAGAGTGRK